MRCPVNFDKLNVVGVRVALSLVFSLLLGAFSYTQLTAVRFALALVFLLFLPGFNLLEMLYDKTTFLTGLQRFVVSVALSLAIVIIDNYALTYTGIGINLSSLLWALIGETIVLALFPALLKRTRTLRGSRTK